MNYILFFDISLYGKFKIKSMVAVTLCLPASKDNLEGWVTTLGNAGTLYAEAPFAAGFLQQPAFKKREFDRSWDRFFFRFCVARQIFICCEQPDTPYTEPKPMAHVFVFGKTVVGIPLASSAVSIGCNFVRHFEFGKTLLHSNVNDLRAQAAHARRSQRSTASFVMFDPWGCDLFLEKRRERPLAKWMKQYDWTFKSTWIMLIIVSQVAMQHGLNTVY